MRMPGFTAEATVYRTRSSYYGGHGARAGEAAVRASASPPGFLARPPERNGQGQFGVEAGGSPPPVGGCWYGNWCGPGCGSGNPINNLDACCRTHDLCYTARGFGACSCDLDLIGCAFPKQFEFWNPLKAIAAGTIVGVFTKKVTSGVCPPEGGTGGTPPPSGPQNCSTDVCPPLQAIRCCGGLECQNGRCVPRGGGQTP